MNKWTPGPWKIPRRITIWHESGVRIAVASQGENGRRLTKEQNSINARLIAAAPEMAELLWRKDMLSPQWLLDRKDLLARINGEDDGDT